MVKKVSALTCANCGGALTATSDAPTSTVVHTDSGYVACDPDALRRTHSSTAVYTGTWARVKK